MAGSSEATEGLIECGGNEELGGGVILLYGCITPRKLEALKATEGVELGCWVVNMPIPSHELHANQ